MEKNWQLPTPDGATIYGRTNTGKHKTDRAIFIVHGLTGHMNEYHLKQAADYFSTKEYDVYRFNLYDGNPGARSTLTCTLQTHADDLNTVIKHFKKNYKKIFTIGHSLGGATVFQSLIPPKGGIHECTSKAQPKSQKRSRPNKPKAPKHSMAHFQKTHPPPRNLPPIPNAPPVLSASCTHNAKPPPPQT